MTAFLGDVTSVTANLFSIAGQAVTAVTSNPILLVFTCIAVVGAGVGLFQRLRG